METPHGVEGGERKSTLVDVAAPAVELTYGCECVERCRYSADVVAHGGEVCEQQGSFFRRRGQRDTLGGEEPQYTEARV